MVAVKDTPLWQTTHDFKIGRFLFIKNTTIATAATATTKPPIIINTTSEFITTK